MGKKLYLLVVFLLTCMHVVMCHWSSLKTNFDFSPQENMIVEKTIAKAFEESNLLNIYAGYILHEITECLLFMLVVSLPILRSTLVFSITSAKTTVISLVQWLIWNKNVISCFLICILMSIFWLYNLQELIITKTKNSSIKLSAGWNIFFYVQFIREQKLF